jgi:uncharacterized protein (TIGR02265 family)
MASGGDPEFVAPDYSLPIDVDACIARCPPDATAKGMFLTTCVDLGRRAAPSRVDEVFAGVGARRWMPFLEYPLRDNMRLMFNASRLRWPGEPVRERLRRVGWLSYPTFADSMAGRVILGVTSKDLESKFSILTKSFSLSVSHAKVTPRRVGDRHWQIDYKRVYCFLDSYHVGIIEGFVRVHGHEPTMRVRLTSPESGTFDLRW